eukprot:scaffold1625_cov192-Alexandrium_tamarense.AAC.24
MATSDSTKERESECTEKGESDVIAPGLIPTDANRYNRVILSLLWYVEQAEYFHPFYIVFMDVFCRGETTNKLIETIALQVRQLKEVP